MENNINKSPIGKPLVSNDHKDRITNTLLWNVLIGISFFLIIVYILSIVYDFKNGIGSWGLNKTIAWCLTIANFNGWIGIAYAAVLSLSVLLLIGFNWSKKLYASLVAIIPFAAICAILFLLIQNINILSHSIFPYPNTRSNQAINSFGPILWYMFILFVTFLVITILFSYFGYNKNRVKGSSLFKSIIFLVVPGLPVILYFFYNQFFSQSNVNVFLLQFLLPVLSGLFIVFIIMLFIRKVFHLEAYITIDHIESINLACLVGSSIVGIVYAFHSINKSDFTNLFENENVFELIAIGSLALPLLFLFKKVRKNITFTLVLISIVSIGLWVTNYWHFTKFLHRDFLPSSWSYYIPAYTQLGISIGAIGIFFFLYLLFLRIFFIIKY